MSKEQKKNAMDEIFEGIRKDVNEDKYSAFRMKTSILNDMKKIAADENVTYPGRLIHKVLEDWIEEYKKTKKES